VDNPAPAAAKRATDTIAIREKRVVKAVRDPFSSEHLSDKIR
jgi:hypothetical protein